MKKVYAVLCVIGVALPYWPLMSWMTGDNLSVGAFFAEAFSTWIGMFAWMDALVAGVVLFVFVFNEGRRLHMKLLWLPVLGTCAVGVSLGFPLFLLLREVHLTKKGL